MVSEAGRTWGFLGLWAVAAASIVVAATSPPPSGAVGEIVQSVGRFYLRGTAMLYEFGRQAAPPLLVMNVIYVVLGVIAWGSVGVALDRYGYHSIEGDVAALAVGIAVLVGIAVVLMGYGPQFLMLGVVGVAISAVVVAVP